MPGTVADTEEIKMNWCGIMRKRDICCGWGTCCRDHGKLFEWDEGHGEEGV